MNFPHAPPPQGMHMPHLVQPSPWPALWVVPRTILGPCTSPCTCCQSSFCLLAVYALAGKLSCFCISQPPKQFVTRKLFSSQIPSRSQEIENSPPTLELFHWLWTIILLPPPPHPQVINLILMRKSWPEQKTVPNTRTSESLHSLKDVVL